MKFNEKELKKEFKKKFKYEYYRSPIRYKGSKYLLLPILLPIFNLSNKKIFVDVFGGSGTISINVSKNLDFKKVIYNDIDKRVYKIFKMLIEEDVFDDLIEIQNKYLPNKIKYYNDDYKKLSNEMKEIIKIEWKEFKKQIDDVKKEFVLFCNSLEDVSKKQKISSFSVGARSIQKNKSKEIKNMFGLNIEILNKNYYELDFKDALLYLDPPYLATGHLYDGWSKEDEIKFLKWIDNQVEKGNDFVLSNVENDYVNEFKKKYNYIEFDKDYKAVGGKFKNYKELIITNLDINELFNKKDNVSDLDELF